MQKLTIIKTALLVVVLLPVLAVAHFYTPGVDVVRITGINTIRVDTDSDPNNNDRPGQTRDVYEIFAESLDKRHAYVYENDDDWRYLKFDSSDVQSRANAIATGREDKDRIAAVTNIGWRIPLLSMFPNALSVKSVEASYSTFPVVGTIIWGVVALLLLAALLFYRRWSANRRAARAAREAAIEAELRRSESIRNDAKDDVVRRFIDNE